MKVSVIISTYNAPEWLHKVLWGYDCQSFDNFELIIADFGGFEETKSVVDSLRKLLRSHIYHLTNPAGKVSRAQILNEAVLTSEAEYCIFTNDHCIPRNDFVEAHLKMANRGRYLTGGTFNLPRKTSECIDRQDISTLFAFELHWLLLNGWKPGLVPMQLVNLGITNRFSDAFPWNSATWNSHNSSAFRDDVLSINGFNEACPSMQIDDEFNIRLINKRLEGVAINSRAVCLHLKGNEESAVHQDETKGDCLGRVPKDATWINTGIVKADSPETIGGEDPSSLYQRSRNRPQRKEKSYNS